MTTKVEKSIQVDVPVNTVYNQWTQFQDFPQFMGGVQQVVQLDDRRMHWVAEIAGVKREWDAAVLEQVPDHKIAWAATSGATNAGAVTFAPGEPGKTWVTLTLEYEPEGVVEKIGDALSIVEKRVEADLEKFKSFIESEGYATGSWRGSINEGSTVGAPGIADAAASRGDDGKAGVSTKAVIAGVAAAAGVAGVAAASALSGSDKDDGDAEREPTTVDAGTPVATGARLDTAAPVDVIDVVDVRDDVVDVREPDVVTVTPTTTATTVTPTATLPPLATQSTDARDDRDRTV
jgi:uncharacterized protein YndB with AHSA1/START domain